MNISMRRIARRKILEGTFGLCIMVCCWISPLMANSSKDAEAARVDSIRAARKVELEKFKGKYFPITLSVNSTTNIPELAMGDLSKGLTNTDAVAASYEFFEINREVFGLTDPKSDLKIDKVSKDQYGTLVTFTQSYKGITVRSGDIKLAFGKTGKLRSVSGSPYPDISISVTPDLDSASAVEIALRELKLPSPHRSALLESVGKGNRAASATLSIMSKENKYYLVWIVGIYVDPNSNIGEGLWEYDIDAHTGSILNRATPDVGEIRQKHGEVPIRLPTSETLRVGTTTTPVPNFQKGDLKNFVETPKGNGTSSSIKQLPCSIYELNSYARLGN